MWFLFPTVAFSETEVDTPCKLLHIPSAMKFTSCRFHSSVKISLFYPSGHYLCYHVRVSSECDGVFLRETLEQVTRASLMAAIWNSCTCVLCVTGWWCTCINLHEYLEVHVSILFHDRCLETEQGLCCQSHVATFICSICLRLLWLWSCCFRCSLFLQVLATKHVVFVASQPLRMCWFCKMTSVCSQTTNMSGWKSFWMFVFQGSACI